MHCYVIFAIPCIVLCFNCNFEVQLGFDNKISIFFVPTIIGIRYWELIKNPPFLLHIRFVSPNLTLSWFPCVIVLRSKLPPNNFLDYFAYSSFIHYYKNSGLSYNYVKYERKREKGKQKKRLRNLNTENNVWKISKLYQSIIGPCKVN